MYLGSWKIDDAITFSVNTHNPATGAAADATGAPPYRIYEDETTSPILTGSMALLDDANTAGFYSEQITASVANGFEKGKSYTIYITATVNSVAGTISHTLQIEAEVDVVSISGDSVAADNLESTYDGTGYEDDKAPSTQEQVGKLTSGTAAINTTAGSFVKSGAEPETNTYLDTIAEDGVYHIVEDVAGATDAYYQFDVGSEGIPVGITWIGYAQSQSDSYAIYAYNYISASYEQIGNISGSNGTTSVTNEFKLTNAHVGIGANLGKVRFRFLSADGTAFATDRILCSYAIAHTFQVLNAGVAQSATINTLILATTASAVDGAYDPSEITIVRGTGAGQTRLCYQYDGTARRYVVDRDWKVTPDSTSEYRVESNPGREHVNEGLAQGAGTGNNQIQLNVLASASNDAYKNQIVFLRSGTGEDQVGLIIAYNGTTKIATVHRDWPGSNPDVTTAYVVLPTQLCDPESIVSILADTNELQANQGNWLTATGFATSGALSTHDTKLDGVETKNKRSIC